VSGNIQPPGGLIELPGLKGTIQIRYDLTKGIVDVDARGMAYAQLVQLLLAAVQGAVTSWAMQEAGIIRPKKEAREAREEGSTDGSEKASDTKNDDDHD